MKIASELNLRNTENVESLEAFGYVCIGKFKNSIRFEKFCSQLVPEKSLTMEINEISFGGTLMCFFILIHRILILMKSRKSFQVR